jgi:FixJ family two-component response regulator
MSATTGTVFLVDDDARVLKAMSRLLGSDGWSTRSYPSGRAFLADYDGAEPGCLVLDLLMPEMSGLEVQRELGRLGDHRPIIFLSGRGDVPSSVTAMKSGAADFLTKPVDGAILLAAVGSAMERDARRRATASLALGLRARLSSLTARERQVLDGVVAGLLNKQIAGRLGIVEKTVKVHRARAVAKLGARSTADLVRLVEAASGDPAESSAQAHAAGPRLHS